MVSRERAYHTHEVKRLNDLLRRHNHLAPFTARKGLILLDAELAMMMSRSLPRLIGEVRAGLEAKGDRGERREGWDAGMTRDGLVRYDVWGREVRSSDAAEGEPGRQRGWLDGWWANGVSESRGGGGQRKLAETDAVQDVQSLGLLAAIQKSLSWARQLVRV